MHFILQLASNVSVQSKIQSYLRYGLRIAKKTEINKRLTDQDDYKQKMIEKYLDRAREINNSGLYKIVRGQGGKNNLLYFEKDARRTNLITKREMTNRNTNTPDKTGANKTENAVKPSVLQSIRDKQIHQYRFYADKKVRDQSDSDGTGRKKTSEIATKKGVRRIATEDLRIKRQKILNEMVQAKGDANKLHDLNLQFSRIDNELGLRNQ